MITDADTAWARELQKSIWGFFPRDRFGRRMPREERKLTAEERERVLSLARSGDYVVDMFNAVMGFGVGIALCTPPPYPGVEGEHVLSVTSDHFDMRFPEAWELFSPIALSEDNQARHEFAYGKRLSTDRSHYDY